MEEDTEWCPECGYFGIQCECDLFYTGEDEEE